MCFFRKKKTSMKQITEDRNLILTNQKTIETLITISQNSEFTEVLKKLQEQLKYLTPSRSEKIFSYDKKIKDAIEDLKIALTKNGDAESNAKALKILQDIKVLIADRNVSL